MISIIIPVFNRAELIKDTLQSIIEQTSSKWECIIVDDGSVDNTVSVVSEFCIKDDRFKILKRNREPKGAPTCRNIGYQNATYDYIIFLDSDDFLVPWCIEERLEFVLNNKDLDFALFPAIEINKNKTSKNINYISIIQNHHLLEYFISFEPSWVISCPIWKKTILNKLNGWNEKCIAWQDPEIHIRALLSNTKYKWATEIPDVFVMTGVINSITQTNSIEKQINIFNTYYNIYTFLEYENKILFKKNIIIRLYNTIENIDFNESLKLLNSTDENVISKIELLKLQIYNFFYHITKNIIFIKGVVYHLRKIFMERKRFYQIKPNLDENKYNRLYNMLLKHNSFLIKYL